ncbi:hypothetical protein C672_1857 [[Clostridium] bifermentans ATCC 638]|uniref:Bacteriophage HK97-gp10, tail-component family protein n=1 Tax=Paraclostridium bifermentans ATCC 638 = DSM 14991 TaxID=1233171 RepID=T4VN32_PARBF|nr:HK97-gp10 family putative phage morphogenesis protein [Paraclostridium bifermentans]EQK42913.1 hypothetical protein C672_1857 [[Clostridium] bifermentans ATCC 638] [Paraclostridium bifermentans ATCC 638 = DSM 14991]RIZ58042.1 hypothetical protein CHH45_13415 [Paraclostridium bifermentans]UAG16797.1 HK97 gp10 family phage protein [Paraclostridium bifermentans]
MGLKYDFSALIDKLDDMEKSIQKDVAKNALSKGADVLLKAQIEKAPIDSGELVSSLDKTNIKGNGLKAKINIGIENGDKDTIRYGYYQEYGTENMVGKKWMKSAWNEGIKEASDEIKESIVNDLLK